MKNKRHFFFLNKKHYYVNMSVSYVVMVEKLVSLILTVYSILFNS